MPTTRWQRLLEVFEEAAARNGVERRRYLEAACAADAALLADVEKLLAAHDTPHSVLDRPLPAFVRAGELDAESMVGRQLGPYRILRLLGEGGMGQVFEAEQREPLERRVALKLIKLGMDTREVIARFEAERRTLALMAHPAIAVVHDAGATPEGRPFFVMELVDGQPIDEYCDARRLTVPERLDLFLTVCRGVEHAHRRGVLHRDLKPSNVLVSERDGRALPKIIDFGIAKVVGPEGAGTLGTSLGLLAGTPEYMSPEQAALGGDVDTRTDVYSLGVVLYGLLAGELPLDEERLRRAGLVEALRTVREEEPPPPSSRISAAPEAAAEEAARHRGTDRRSLERQLAGELDWIVAKALAKERHERYSSVAELAADIERQRRGEPVAAGPQGRLYRLRKLVGRHRVEAAAAALLLLALTGFGAAMAVQSRRLARALVTVEREGATAKRVSEFLVHLLEQTDPAVARGAEITVRQVLDSGAADLERELADQPEVRATLLETIGRVYANLGLYDQAMAQLEPALELRRRLTGGEHAQVAAVLQLLGEVEVARGDYARARQLAERALAMRQRLLDPGDPALAGTLDLLGSLDRLGGDLATAGRRHEQALAIRRAALGDADPAVAETWNLLGIVRRQRGDYEGAEAAYRQALAIWRGSLGEDHPDVAMGMNNLALLLHVRGKHAEALRLFDALVPLRRRLLGGEHADFLITLANLAKLFHDMGDLAAAERVYRDAIAVGRRSFGADHPQLAAMLADFGGVLGKLERFDEALAAEDEALAIRRKVLGEENYLIAASQLYLAEIHAARGDTGAADPLFAEAVERYRRALGEHQWTASAMITRALFLIDTARAEEAEPMLREAVSMLRAKVPAGDRRLAIAASALGAGLTELGRFEEAEGLLRGALQTLAETETPETRKARQRLVDLYEASGRPELGAPLRPALRAD